MTGEPGAGAYREVLTEAHMKVRQDIHLEYPDEGAVRISGRVKEPVVLSVRDLRTLETEVLEDLFVICGSGDPKGSIGSCRGVLLENAIRQAEVLKEEHNDTKKMFLVASSDDGYKVVFSWQEIFNTSVGGGIMVLLEKDGKPLEQGRVDLISAQDYFMGSRYVKKLTNIEVVLFA
jgi:hypothetical protein